MAGDRERCLEAGMDDYLSKPVQRDDLLFALQRHLGGLRDGTPATPGAQRVDPSTLLCTDVPRLTTEAIRALDPLAIRLIDETRTDELDTLDHMLGELVTMFAVQAPEQMAAMADAVDAGDIDRFRDDAHTLKGTALSLGATRVGVIAAQLHLLAKTGTTEGAGPLLALLDAAFRQTVVGLRAEVERYVPTSRAAPRSEHDAVRSLPRGLMATARASADREAAEAATQRARRLADLGVGKRHVPDEPPDRDGGVEPAPGAADPASPAVDPSSGEGPASSADPRRAARDASGAAPSSTTAGPAVTADPAVGAEPDPAPAVLPESDRPPTGADPASGGVPVGSSSNSHARRPRPSGDADPEREAIR
jgi:HPt (histidine-containing phosphotransfer) domain-containing protein